MRGIYDRDFSKLTDEETQARDRLDAESIIPGTKFRKNCYHQYPKAVRHNMSLFPNNFMDIVDLNNTEALNQQCNEFEKLLQDVTITELDIKRFIQDKKYYHIIASLLKQYSFGHHSAYVFKEFKLGTYFSADYLLVGDSSDGHQFVFVEFENPYKNITISDGNFGDTIRKGINQINDWKYFLEKNFTTLYSEFEKYTNDNLPDEFRRYDSTRMNYLVVAGRRADFKEKTRTLRRYSEKNDNIKILHYDNLLDIAINTIGENTY